MDIPPLIGSDFFATSFGGEKSDMDQDEEGGLTFKVKGIPRGSILIG